MATSDLRERFTQRMGAVFNVATSLMLDELRVAAPEGETGDTRRGLAVVPGGTVTHPTAQVVSTGKGGDFVEHGTRAWSKQMPPGRGNVMVFKATGGRISTAAPNSRVPTVSGPLVFTKSVDHPAVPARPWFEPVVSRWTEFLERAAAQVG